MRKVVDADMTDELKKALESLPSKIKTKALLEVVEEMDVPIEVLMGQVKYFPGRKIDRQNVFERIFKGETLTHEDMFSSRGFRGLNVVPFPQHVRE